MKKYLIIAIFIFLALQVRAALALEWAADLTLPQVGVTAICQPAVGTPYMLPTGQQCNGPQVQANVHYRDSTLLDSGIKAYSPLGTNCLPGPSITVAVPQITIAQTCIITTPTGPITARTNDAAGNKNSGTIQAEFLQPWYRIKAGSFHKFGSALTNLVPALPLPYNTADPDEGSELQQYFVMGRTSGSPLSDAGVVTSQGSMNIGSATNVSRHDWKATSYERTLTNEGDLAEYIGYIRARKNFKLITDLDELESDRINIYDGNLSIPDTTVIGENDNFVLIVEGDVTFTGNFNAATPLRNIAILSTSDINITANVSTLNAILIGSAIDTASDRTDTNPATNALKIKGNLISYTPITDLKRRRTELELQRPSVYIVFAPEMYAALLPHLSTTAQEGRTIE